MQHWHLRHHSLSEVVIEVVEDEEEELVVVDDEEEVVVVDDEEEVVVVDDEEEVVVVDDDDEVVVVVLDDEVVVVVLDDEVVVVAAPSRRFGSFTKAKSMFKPAGLEKMLTKPILNPGSCCLCCKRRKTIP